MKKKCLSDLFIELAKPNENGESRIVSKTEFIGEFSDLFFTNGCNWMRSLKGKFLYSTLGRGDSWTIKLNGVDNGYHNRSIRTDIVKSIVMKKCVHTGFSGTTQNSIECDHKNGRYDDLNVLVLKSQKMEDFQPLCRQANLLKRSDCKSCKLTGERFDAKTLGYNTSYIDGVSDYNGSCIGCYWYDPKLFKNSVG